MEIKQFKAAGIKPQYVVSSRYQRALARLAGLLRGRYLTVRQIAARTHCSRVQVYRRLEALRASHTLYEGRVRERPTGPLARAFCIDPRGA